MLRLRSGNRQKVGEGYQGSNQEILAPSFFKSCIFHNDGVDWSGVLFWREKFSSFGTLGYKYGFENGLGVTCFICESSEFKDLVRIILSD